MNKLFLLALCVAAIGVTLAEDKFTDKYDNIDIEEILKNDRLFSSYFKCLMDQGKCTSEGAELKKYLPEAIKSQCGPCTDKQKEAAKKVIKYLVETKKEQWNALMNKWDPDRTYREKYEASLSEILGS